MSPTRHSTMRWRSLAVPVAQVSPPGSALVVLQLINRPQRLYCSASTLDAFCCNAMALTCCMAQKHCCLQC